MRVQARDIPQEMVDLLIMARMCGATIRQAVDWALHECFPGGKANYGRKHDAKPYTPRYDPALATPRLHERDWWPLRSRILKRDGYRCTYCGDEAGCADHVVPLSRGGSNEPENLAACCLPCNSSKSDRLLSEWRGRV